MEEAAQASARAPPASPTSPAQPSPSAQPAQPTQPAKPAEPGLVPRTKAWLQEHWRDPLYRNSYLLMLNTMVITGSGFVFWLIAARLVPPEGIGLATAAVSAMVLLSMVAKLGFDVSFMRHLPTMESAKAHRLINTAFTLSGAVAVVGALVFAAGTPIWSPALDVLRHNTTYLVGFAALTLVWTHGTLLDSLFTARRRAEFVLYKNTVHSVLKIVALLALAAIGAAGVVLGWTASMLVALAVAMVLWLRRADQGFVPRIRVHGGALKGVIATSFANYAVSFILALPPALGSLIILHRFGAAAAGYFYVLWMFGSVAMAAPQMLGQSALVEMSHRSSAKGMPMGRSLLISGIVTTGVFFAGIVLLPFFGEYYTREGLLPLLPFSLAAVPGVLIYSSLAKMRAVGRHVPLVLTSILLVTAFAIGTFAIPEQWGVAQVGWVWLGALIMSATLAVLSSA